MNLIIVESPTKARTITRYLGSGFKVLSSFGHVRDLPKSKLGVDVEHNFAPQYVIPAKAKKVIAELKEAVEKSDTILLATDPDREGEAISWHLSEALHFKKKKVQRIVFHEITKSAIQEALEHPRELDFNLIDAQQARRVLDRLVGYELSPFLWKKIRYGLSAGRVQSVAVRLVVERERDIQKFAKEEYWSVEADFKKKTGGPKFRGRLIKIGEKSLGKMDLKNAASAKKILSTLDGADYRVADITKKEVNRHPAPPFTTSTLQQEAARKLGMSAKQTMMIAQQLYENGYITYMRTDSVHLAQSAVSQAREAIKKCFGANYSQSRQYTTKSKGAQEAHEAVRPTDFFKSPDLIKGELERSQSRLYDLIWKRAIASQMASAAFDQTSVDIEAKPRTANTLHTFRANGQMVKFDGFIRAYIEGQDDHSDREDNSGTSTVTSGVEAPTATSELPDLILDEILKLLDLLPLQHFTEPPPRYTDATLIKALEAHGVGRPSTYAPTLSTIQERDYVAKVDKKYQPTEIGILVNDMLVENFPEIIDINFTSHMEEELDNIAEGKLKWVPVIEEFYTPFKKHLMEKEASVEKLAETSTTPCPHCGQMMLIKFGRMGKFMACPDPESKVTLPLPEEAAKIKELEEKTRGENCPLCSKPMIVKRGRFGYFLGCSDYPTCRGISKIWNKTGFKCPVCHAGDIVEKKSRGRGKVFYACTNYPDCNFLMSKKPESEVELREALQHWKDNPPKPKPKKEKTSDPSNTG